MTHVYAILGWPVAHSRSPAMHNAALAACGVDAVYVPFAVKPQNLASAIQGARALGIQGFNLTVPHKEAVMQILDSIEPQARAIGAVNSVVREGDKWVGFNTDAQGLVNALLHDGLTLQGAHVVVVGAGGAARAALVGLSQAGVQSITVAARDPDKAHAMIQDLQSAGAAVGPIHESPLQGEGLVETLRNADVLVNATSATLHDDASAHGLINALCLTELSKHSVVVDMVYGKQGTPLTCAAQQQGLKTMDGLGMLLYQGALAFERWTGQPAPVEVMRQALG